MPKLPRLNGKQVVKALGKEGWQVARQRGSHIILVRSASIATISVPNHKEIAKGTLRSIIRSSGLSVEEFLELL